MDDHPVTDLSYGHLGKASYDTEENEWKFSVDLTHKSSIQQVTPFKEWSAPALEIHDSGHKSTLELISQRKWLKKAHPETCPADALAAELNKVDLSPEKDVPPQNGSLLAVARAVDIDRVSGSRTTQILAVPYGDAGHILRLIRPRIEVRGWEKHGAARLTLLDAENPEYGHWVGEGGVIRQIVASDAQNGSGTWLAVRQDTVTTIFRPQYGRLHDASTTINGFPERFPTSRVVPSPVATVTANRTKSRMHADVSFNPWYARQFAVVDTLGMWSIWDLETGHGRKALQILVPGKRGSIYDDYTPDPAHKPQDFGHADGWYRILWICDISTILVCNRRHMALVKFNEGTSRLQTTKIFPAKGHDWILDIKRSTTSNTHFFVLTTSRIFWLKVNLDESGAEKHSSDVQVILSYKHFRNVDDETIKLTVLRDTSVSVLITSALTSLVQFYCFRESEKHDIPMSYQGSFNFSCDDRHHTVGSALSSISFLPCPLAYIESARSTGVGLQYIENDVKFFQVWSLNSNLGLSSSFFAAQEWSLASLGEALSIIAPTTRVAQSARRFGSKVIDESFIVPDGEDDEDVVEDAGRRTLQRNMQAMLLDEVQGDLRLRINWASIYRYTFGLDMEGITSVEDVPSIRELLARTSDLIDHGVASNELPISTITELSKFKAVSEDTGGAAQVLQEFLQTLDSETRTSLIVSNLLHFLDDQKPTHETSQYPDLWRLYDQLAEYWMSSLPSNLTATARLARHRVVQQLAMDVCLSSICISVQNKLVSNEEAPQDKDMEEMSTFDRDSRFSRDSSPLFFSSQLAAIPEEEPRVPFPTPSKTPSLYSYTTSGSEVREDPAITRLRQYARSIKDKPDPGVSSILSHWPAQPGTDPALYSYEAAQKAAVAAESGDEGGHRNRKEEARRRRRTEKFLRQTGSRAVETAAQSALKPSGSQPTAANHPASSQSVADLPMTQPVLGTFGSRKGEKDKGKPKKRRTAGFR